jgi:polyhydroxyalkanoate synthesis regulator phasin
MGDQKSSAKPHQLLAYFTETQKINDALQRHHSPLVEALQRFQSTCTEFPVSYDLASLPEQLSRLVGYAQERDIWVRDVGLGFLTADSAPQRNQRFGLLAVTKAQVKNVSRKQTSGSFLLASVFSGTFSLQLNYYLWERLIKHIKEAIRKIRERGSVSEEDARKIFDDMADEKDIPYQFPDDGCYARAHEMVKRISERYKIELNDITKVFIEGDLEADTPYKYEPVIDFHDGETMRSTTTDNTVNWGWHVAPVIKVRQGDKIVDMVIDPSLAKGPITIDEWKKIMKDSNAVTTKTDYKQYMPNYRFEDEEGKKKVDEHSRNTLDKYLKPCVEKGYCKP